ncbi:hypothetical protein [Janthinobacterium sp. BJB304]|uniref:hypothetical protein n=1 Tax=Janthinobacterium sp. BJB304 TaxID=1572871 RepID=UPI000C109139|nr:hypothetical protein [Janthinobacterium sp. BJB304]PHV36886.1 hypothetical protein CSQ95_21785 [Janthinobacterium sp. BJB304]
MFNNIHLLKQANVRLRNTPYFTVLCLAGALLMAMLAMVVLGGSGMVLGWLADEAWAVFESFAVQFVRQLRW